MKEKLYHINIFRYNPLSEEKPYMQQYSVEAKDGFSLFNALKYLKENNDSSLNFDFVCRSSICGSCAMLINGKPGLACKTLLKNLPSKINLHPLPYFKMLGDLSVDTGVWFRGLSEKTEGWLHFSDKNEILNEKLCSNEEMSEVYELDRCIECGCCIAACSTANIKENFIGAAGLLKVARFMVDPRDIRDSNNWYEIIGSDEGIFGCMGLLACDDYCPKDIPLQKSLSMLRRKMALAGILK